MAGDEGLDPAFGARPMARVIEEHVKKPLAEAMLFGKPQEGGTAKVERKGMVWELRQRRVRRDQSAFGTANSKSSLTDGRSRTTKVKMPRTVPSGLHMAHIKPAMIRTNR
jgi:hypothetical protein